MIQREYPQLSVARQCELVGLARSLIAGVGRWFVFYNERRFHQALDYATPAQIYRAA